MAIATSGRRAVASDLLPDLLARRGEAWVREASASMAPILRPGDRLLLQLAAAPELSRGMLVAYRRWNRVVVHRLVGRNEQGLVVKGDDAEATECVSAGDVLARVVAVRRPSGRTIRLDRFPWPALGRLLAFLSLGAGRRAASVRSRVARLPIRVIGRLAG